MPLLLLHHVGAKSGTDRIAPLAYIEDDGRYAIFASKGGAPENPAWYHNLLANPDTTIEIGGETIEVTATEARARSGTVSSPRRRKGSPVRRVPREDATQDPGHRADAKGSMDFDYDWLVIGSGFGGSVSALRLAEKGYSVGVLECGRRFRDEEFAQRDGGLPPLQLGATPRYARDPAVEHLPGRVRAFRLRGGRR